MASLNGFNADEVEPAGVFELIPAADYIAAIVESEMRPTKNGLGKLLELKFQILEGSLNGRTLFERLNLENPSQQAVQIARSQLSSICRAIGVHKPTDSHDLHNLPLVIKVGVEKNKESGEQFNRIKGYKPKNTSAAQPATTPTKAPWKKS